MSKNVKYIKFKCLFASLAYEIETNKIILLLFEFLLEKVDPRVSNNIE